MPPPIVAPHPRGTVINVWAVPGADRDEIVGRHGEAVRIRVTAPAERWRGNVAILAMLEEALGVPVTLLSGAGGRRKRVLARGMRPAQALALLGL